MATTRITQAELLELMNDIGEVMTELSLVYTERDEHWAAALERARTARHRLRALVERPEHARAEPIWDITRPFCFEGAEYGSQQELEDYDDGRDAIIAINLHHNRRP